MAGVNIVIVKEAALGKVSRQIPTMLDYATHVKSGSMFNTPPVVPIYCAMKNLEWMKKNGGVEAMAKRAEERADMLYAEIDRNKLFRGMVGIKGHRSVGGFRASCYNAQTVEGVQALIQSMKDFEAQH